MRALNLAVLPGLTLICVAILAGCGGASSSADNTLNTPSVSEAESKLGASLLPPDGVVAVASSLAQEDFPPGDATASTSVDAGDLPPV